MNLAHASDKLDVSVRTDIVHAILSASPIVQFTLLVLVGMSIFSWTIIFSKRKQLNRAKRANDLFVSRFWKSSSLEEVFKDFKNHSDSPIARVFHAGYIELQRLADLQKNQAQTLLPPIDNLERSLRKTIESEINDLEQRLSFLATTGSSGPFIGLFGTVWGIMSAFGKIGQTGMASLAVVAPGISEALVATAVGLAAAIPASMAYNHFMSQLRKEETGMNSFASDLTNIARRSFIKGA